MPTIERTARARAHLLTPNDAAARLSLPRAALWELAERELLRPIVEEDEAGYRREDVERLAVARAADDRAALTHEEAAAALAGDIAALHAENQALRQQLAAARLATVSAVGPRGRSHPAGAWRPVRAVLAVLLGAIRRFGLVEFGTLAVVLLVALALRTYGLTTLPGGVHGDEEVNGLAAEQILREGAIGPYTGMARGMPTGTFYVTALSVWLFGNTILAVRLVSALFATATVLALYLIMRRAFGGTAALLGATLLATMGWHIFFARVGYPVIAWPLCILLAIGLLAGALRRGDWRWWAGAGVATGLGIYIYNAHLLFIAVMGLIVTIYIAWDTYYARRQTLRQRLLLPGVLAGALLVTAGPMIAFATAPDSDYFSHTQQVSIFTQPEWIAQQGTGAEVRFLADRYAHYWDQLCCHPVMDGVDGTGVTPLIPLVMLLLALAGAGIGLARYRHPLIPMALLVVLIMPLGSVLTVEGMARRTFPVAPFLALFAALPLAGLLDVARRRWRATGGQAWYAPLAGVAVVVLLLGTTFVNLDDYFRRFAGSYENRWVFAAEITDASLFMNTLPARSQVYFFSDRWSFNYETRLYLAPTTAGEDRSAEYGKRTDLDIAEADKPTVYIFFGDYRAHLDEVRSLYPDGRVTTGRRDGQTTFVAYSVPAR